VATVRNNSFIDTLPDRLSDLQKNYWRKTELYAKSMKQCQYMTASFAIRKC